jgi:hypothetical protein
LEGLGGRERKGKRGNERYEHLPCVSGKGLNGRSKRAVQRSVWGMSMVWIWRGILAVWASFLLLENLGYEGKESTRTIGFVAGDHEE